MQPVKDRFSGQSDQYQKYRPAYPAAFIAALLDKVPGRRSAWDCATGNGQVAAAIAPYVEQVVATDISAAQLQYAAPAPNLTYAVGRAETTEFADDQFDLITVGQAAHWFDLDRFYEEVRRVIRPDGVLALFGYGLIRIDAAVDQQLDHFYTRVVGPYWDAERRLVDDAYQTIPFPFEEIPLPTFAIQSAWSLTDLAGYLNTWSSVKKYVAANGVNPVTEFIAQLQSVWPESVTKPIAFPGFGRVGVVRK